MLTRLLRSPEWWVTAGWIALESVYWVGALSLRSFVRASAGECSWSSGPAGRLLPWPEPPGILTVITACRNPADHAVAFLLTTHLWPVAFVLSAFTVLLLASLARHRLGTGGRRVPPR